MATPTSVWEEVAPATSRYLSDEHRDVLEHGSLIDPDVIDSRGYYTLDKRQILQLVAMEIITPSAMRAESWMGIPMFRPDGSLHGEVIRKFGPDIGAMKYVWPTGLRLCLDVHPDSLAHLLNTEIPVLFTEGIKKADAILSAARREGIPLVVLAVNGCDGWKTKVEGSSIASPDFLDMALEDRKAYVNSDSDYRTNANVSRGWNQCATYLSSKTGEHRTFLVITPPSGLDKQGADDYLAAGNSLTDLLSLAQNPERAVLDSSGERPRLQLKTGKRLIAEAGDAIPHLLHPLFPERSISLFAGHSGTYKTWNMLALALDGACGLPWLGHPGLTAEQGTFTSLYVNKEMSGLILGQRLKTLSRNEKYTSIPDFDQIVEQRMLFADEEDLNLQHEDEQKRLEDAIWESGAKLVILDSLSMCWHGDENSASEVGSFYAQLRGIISRTGCCFTLLHHLLKPPGGKPAKGGQISQFAIRGSGQLYQQADACVMVDMYRGSDTMHAEDERLIAMHHVKARTSIELPAWLGKFSSNDGLFQSLSYLCLLVDAKAETYAETGSSVSLQDWILEACRTMPAMRPTPGSPGFRGPQLCKILQQSWNVDGKQPPSESALQRNIKELVDQGKLVILSASKKTGNLYQLADEPVETNGEEGEEPTDPETPLYDPEWEGPEVDTDDENP